MSFTTDLLRNVAVAGHGSTGKTTLIEHALFAGGSISKPETVDSGKTVSDYYDEEIEKKISVHASLSHVTWKDRKINFMDTPGSSDFIGDVVPAFRACETALMLIDGRTGVQIETIKLWRNLDSRGKPRAVFVSKLDEDRSDFDRSLSDIKVKFKVNPVAITIPMGAESGFKGVIDVIHGLAYPLPASHDAKESSQPVPQEFSAALEEKKAMLCEAAADGNDELMEKYLGEGSLSAEDMIKGLKLALAANRIVPAFAGSGAKNSGLAALLDFIAEIAPSPFDLTPETAKDSSGAESLVKVDPSLPASALVIKTQIDQFSGRLSYMKVITGKVTTDLEVYNIRENRKERITKLYTLMGKKLEEVKELAAGDIGITTKIASFRTNDTILASWDKPCSYMPLSLPTPVHMVAISAASKKEEDKLTELMLRSTEEDLTFRVNYNAETRETVISGMGELQVNMILGKIKNAAKIDYETRIPRIAYRETITKKASAEYTHKKQTGGHGQYARVVLDIEPLPRGKDFEFENAVFGGAISRNFIPAVEKGVHEAMLGGVVAQYPVVDVKVSVVDGKEHPVDSSELSFKLASRGAFRDSMRNAGPTLLEPIMNLTVFVESQYLGDVMSDLSGRRGKISGQNSISGGFEEIKAQVPQAELLRYSIDLRSMTSGTGSFEVEFDHYSPISGKIAEEVIKAAQAFKTEEAEE